MVRGIGTFVAAGIFALLVLVGPNVLALFAGSGREPFPDPVTDRAVYDPAGAVSDEIEALLEAQIDEIENRSGAEVAIYVRHDPSITPDANATDARRLMDQWGIGRAGYDDGFVILLTFNDSAYQHGELNTWAGAGFHNAYLPESAQQPLRDEVIIPAIQQGSLDGGLLAAMDVIDRSVTEAATGRLEAFRIINAIVGIPGGLFALFATLGLVYVAWRRYGDDPELVDSPSVLMAGPPADMTPPLATVLSKGRATQHSINTTLVDLAGRGLISFRNLDQVKKVKSDDDPDPLVDPAIEILPASQAHSKQLPAPQRETYLAIAAKAVGNELSRERLWSLNEAVSPVKERLESEAVRLGWLTRRPTPIITSWVIIGVVEIVVGVGLVWLGYTLPMSGLTLLGAALGIGGIGTVALGNAMSQRTPKGAYLDAMLKAYRRTLRKTLEQSRNMNEVVAQPEVRVLADTPDKAVVWGIALGLHREVAEVLERGLADAQADPTTRYYPAWLGSSSTSSFGSSSPTMAGAGMAGLFSSSGTPDIGGMFSALGSVGSSPPSSSSGSGGGFGGGGSGGGGGGGSSF
ncbi:MAG TPA: TPM domain-containing protein [Candidatus Limnocylindria bacterium]